MICEYCGAAMENEMAVCPECGEAPRSARIRRVATGDAAKRYHEQLEAGMRGETTTSHPVVRRGQRPAQKPAQRKQRTDMPPESRDASRAGKQTAGAPEGKRAGSMPPPDARRQSVPQTQQNTPRMVRRYSYEAVQPAQRGYENFSWVRLCVVSFVCILILTVGIYLFLSYTSAGQYWLATMGREASMEAYHELGRKYMADGSISRAVRALEIAQSKEPNNLEVLVDLGKAYMGNSQEDQAELAFTRAIQHWPVYPEPYKLLINMMLEDGRNYEAMKLAELAMEAMEATDSVDFFETLYSGLLPATPVPSKLGDRYDALFDLELTAEEGAVIYYAFNGDPLEDGQVYTGPIPLEEGTWKLRAVVEKDGMYSKELVQTYQMVKPTPDMPKAHLQTGTYKTQRTVPLSAGDDCVIYYTVDGTTPTKNSKVYTEPIRLAIGYTTIRAIAVNIDDKTSNELNLTYKCEGSTKTSMNEKDVITGLSLYSTTKSQFIASYGDPISETDDGSDSRGEYVKLAYSFGYAVFLDSGTGSEPVLAELYTQSDAFSGPRSTKVGASFENVIGAFRDVNGEENAQGNRVLYKINDGGLSRLGMLTKTDENAYTISYYVQLESKQYVELTYKTENGVVVSMEWLRYDTE